MDACEMFGQNDSENTEVLFGDKLLALANEVKKKENATKEFYFKTSRNITELKNNINKIETENRKLQSEKLASERAYSTVKKENEVLKRKNDELTSERDSLLSIKSEYDQMSKMFGDFSVQFMETRGTISNIYFFNNTFQDFLLPAKFAMKYTTQISTSRFHLKIVDILLAKSVSKKLWNKLAAVLFVTKKRASQIFREFTDTFKLSIIFTIERICRSYDFHLRIR